MGYMTLFAKFNKTRQAIHLWPDYEARLEIGWKVVV